MRKLISLFLVLAMILSLSVTAFADEAETANKATANKDSEYKASIDVNGKYISELKSDEIISVDVAWQDMNFIYYASQQGTWDPGEHKYIGDTNATWNKTTSDITVTNHSNLEVTANLSYTQSVTSVTGKLSKTVLTMESAAQEKYMGENDDKAPSATSTFTIGGDMEETSDTGLGTITVSIEKGDGIQWTVVDNYDDLKSALNKGGNVKLGADITYVGSNTDYLCISSNFNLNLNGKTLSVSNLMSYADTASVSNGTLIATLKGSIISPRGNHFIIDNCTISGLDYYAIYVEKGEVILKNSTVNTGLYVAKGTLTATENVTVNIGGKSQKIAVVSGASAKFGFDPTGKILKGTITDNGDGTWTVS